MKKNIIYVSGLLNFETILNVEKFPIQYFPIDYPFFGVTSSVSGTAFNISKALTTLGDKTLLSSHVGQDLLGRTIINEAKKCKIDVSNVKETLEQTPNTVVLVDRYRNVETYCDLKNVQELSNSFEEEKEAIESADLVVLCNSNFNRPLLKKAKELGKKVATDVHIIGTIYDEFNKEFLENSDIVFLSERGIKDKVYEDFLVDLYNAYHNEIIILGEGREGAMILIGKDRVVYHIDAITIRDIVNTVGSRDALFSAFNHFYLKGKDPLEALKLAEIFTSYKIGVSGSSEGFLSELQVKALAKKIDFAVYKIKEF
ncbi:MAG: carbohydrate kinase family protein [Candidatus Onthovivens sp.]|nr:carbohydrate kinase family protein [Candidatus Onthovivens sp.]